MNKVHRKKKKIVFFRHISSTCSPFFCNESGHHSLHALSLFFFYFFAFFDVVLDERKSHFWFNYYEFQLIWRKCSHDGSTSASQTRSLASKMCFTLYPTINVLIFYSKYFFSFDVLGMNMINPIKYL